MGERKLWMAGALAVLALAANGARAEGGGPPGPRQPPPEALQACAGLAAGAACTVRLPDHTVSGTCRGGPDGAAPLACAPAHGPGGPGGHRGPPPEAIKACAGLAAGTACTAILPDRTVEGTCRSGPDGAGPLACAPARPPPHD